MPDHPRPAGCPRSGGAQAAAASHRDPARDAGPPRSWLLLVVLCAAQFMVILDVTVVNVALPSIGEDLGFAAGDLQWVVTAYVLCTGGLMLLGGRAADLLGPRRLLLGGLGLFTAASLASGLAPSAGALVAARAVQGVGAAALVPAALATVTTSYRGAQRAVALGVWGAIGSAGAAIGVLAGGVLTSLLSWEWVFLVNVPIGIAALLGIVALVPAGRAAPAHGAGAAHGAAGSHGVGAAHGAAGSHGAGTAHGADGPHGAAAPATTASRHGALDLRGAVTLVGGLGVLLYGLEGAAEHGWGATRTVALLGAGALALVAFALLERSAPQPLIPPRTWQVRSLVVSAAVMLGATGILVGSFFLNTLYLQRALDASALQTGLAFLPLALAILAAAHLASRLLPRAGTRTLVIAGLALVALACLLLAAAPDRAEYATDLLPAFLLLGLGVGPVFVAASVAAMADVRHDEAGLASGLMTTAHELGAALGVAVLSAVALGGGLGGGDPAAVAAGFQDGFVVAGAVALGLAVVALPALPSVRPAAGAHAALH
jgi:MFS family permease